MAEANFKVNVPGLAARLAATAEAARLDAERATKLAYVSVSLSTVSTILSIAAVAR